MTQAAQVPEPKQALSPEQEALVTAIAQIFERLIPKANQPAQLEAPKAEVVYIPIEQAAEMLGVSVARLKRAGRAGRFVYFTDQGAKVKLAEMRNFQDAWIVDLPKSRPGGTQYAAAKRKK
jgi:hypothetical protein